MKYFIILLLGITMWSCNGDVPDSSDWDTTPNEDGEHYQGVEYPPVENE